MTLTFVAILAGLVLGLTCNIMAVFAVVCSATLAYLVLIGGSDFGSLVKELVVPSIALQATYMVGLVVRAPVLNFLHRMADTQSRRV